MLASVEAYICVHMLPLVRKKLLHWDRGHSATMGFETGIELSQVQYSENSFVFIIKCAPYGLPTPRYIKKAFLEGLEPSIS